MAVSLLRRRISFPLIENNQLISKVCNFYSESFKILDDEDEVSSSPTSEKSINRRRTDLTLAYASHSSSIRSLSPLIPSCRDHLQGLNIELVDSDLWRVSCGLSNELRGITDEMLRTTSFVAEMVEEEVNCTPKMEDSPNFDEIEDMRLYGRLFYKLDRDSREFEEYNFNFGGKKSSKKGKEKPAKAKESSKKEKPKFVKEKCRTLFEETENWHVEGSNMGKKLRTPTYNQLTGPYHEPFCLDIYISKGSVRACVVHRATSKVVAVVHSISKDMKRDLASRKDSTACAAIGGVLAQRALADDIHNVVYTPRKGEKLEGKRLIVLQSIIDHGIDVNVKIKQRRTTKLTSTRFGQIDEKMRSLLIV